MKRVIRFDKLGCANCAAKMERAVKKLDGVQSANMNFMMKKLTIELSDSEADGILEKVSRVCKKIEPDCKIAG